MQIGEFARICNTKISVLRHYDKEGLLVPDYIDRFTGESSRLLQDERVFYTGRLQREGLVFFKIGVSAGRGSCQPL